MTPDEIRTKGQHIRVPENCVGCSHLARKGCGLGFGARAADWEDINFFNVVEGYRGLRLGFNACHHVKCGPTLVRGGSEEPSFCGLVFEYLGKAGYTRQLNRALLRDEIPVSHGSGTVEGVRVILLRGDATWWAGDALICPDPLTRRKVAGLSGIDQWDYSGFLVNQDAGQWQAPMRYVADSAKRLLSVMMHGDDRIETVCLTARGSRHPRIRGEILELAMHLPGLREVSLCDYHASSWKDWRMTPDKPAAPVEVAAHRRQT